ncbi:tetratricopeptide repeat protein [Jiella avicenniae]|uniref:Tetratricopeptide repeat protein n=1 Tax=Jiella avicenniae TaxID=2907202 RepID=A0A9X1NZQ0_9HYPH|nr:tetratricopeptide repeat protein [Jiella avicenniae]MCE7027239.1 tetratricopeptide repeat protein [Jiella avicenniae]
MGFVARVAVAGVLLVAAASVPPAEAGEAKAAPSGGPQAAATGLDRLYAALKTAPDEAAARAIEDAIWRRWMEAPDLRTADLVREAMARREIYDFAGARTLLDEAVARAPDYAEAYNQRGFVRFLQEDYDGALEDVDRAIEREPRHFAARAGRALILMRQGRHRLAQAELRRAVEIHPFLKERGMLVGEPAKPSEPPRPGIDL